jgi:hypothetical protein
VPAKKDDDGKLRFDLLPHDALTGVVEVLTHGAAKYGDRNWEQGLPASRLFAALQRHLWAWWGGEDADPDSGLSHLEHVATNALMLAAMRGEDDRPGAPRKENVS